MKYIPILFCFLSIQLSAFDGPLQVAESTCQYRTNPLGIEEEQPSLGWKLMSDTNGKRQTAYQILVASTPELLNESEADLWNSGKVLSPQSVAVKYQGAPLRSRQRCYWQVKVWDEEGRQSEYGRPQYWEMGLLSPDDWKARWIRHPDFTDTLLESKPAPFFRKNFRITKKIASARAYVTGLGYFEMHLNGRKVGDHVLDPVKTRYDRTVNYLVFDILSYLKEGDNTIGMVLGTGWYNHFAKAAWQFDQAPWRDYPTLICQMEIRYTDGSRDLVISDRSWKTSQGPILFDGIRNGEYYDARKEMTGWDQPVYNDSDWFKAIEAAGPKGKLKAQDLPPIREMKEITPQSVTEIKPGVFVFDMGQNMSGYCRLKVAGPSGTEIKLKHGEKLYPDGSVEQKQIYRFLKTGEAQTDKYILKGEGIEVWNPRFVYHGFQYVEVSGLPVKPTKETLTGIVIHTSFESAGDFACSDPLLNKIQEITRWSYIGNYHGIPTDCPHREKIGWTGDGHLVAETGLYNYQALTSYLKWLDDHVDEQQPDGNLPGVIPTSGWGYLYGKNEATRHLGYGPSWEGSMVLIPWYLYLYSGDASILQRYYDPLRRYLGHLERNAEQYLLNFGIDDHKAYFTKTEGDIIASGYFYYLTGILVKIADILQMPEDVKTCEQLASRIKKAFLKRYYDSRTASVGNNGQTSLSMGLYMDLVPENDRSKVLDRLLARIDSADFHFDAGVGGVKALYEALSEASMNDVLYKMVTRPDFPGYASWIDQGATTLWQDWDGSMSLNHIMFGSVSEWFFQSIAGINPDPMSPGFKNVILKPTFIEDLQWVSAEYNSVHGKIISNWESKGEKILLKVQIPVNSTGTLQIPNGFRLLQSKEHRFSENILNLGSGNHILELSRE